MVAQSMRTASRAATLVAVPLALVAGLLVFWRFGGFGPATGPVEVAAPELDDRTAVVCRALLAKLPDRLRDLERRPVTAGSEQNAAWGDPPLVLACGQPGPSAPLDAQLFVLSGVCWYVEERADRTVWTMLGREVEITVTVPDRYDPPAQWLVDFSAPVTDTVPASSAPRC